MRIGFIGAGKVGFTFGKYIADKGTKIPLGTNKDILNVSGYYSAHVESACLAAKFTDTRVYDDLQKLCKDSDVIFLTVPDMQIGKVWEKLRFLDIKGKLICHASGAMTSDIFSGISEAGAFGYSIHPMYAISSKYESYKELDNAFFTVEGHEKYAKAICSVIQSLGCDCLQIAGQDKVKYHAAAVFASNFVTGMLALSSRLLMECGFDEESARRALVPLFKGNATSVAEKGPVEGLTGPVERCDLETIKKHLSVLTGDELAVYITVSESLVKVAREKHKDRDYSDLSQMLKEIGELEL